LANNSDELGFKNKAHGSDDFTYTQSGIYEKNILCAECDNKLGVLENTAAKALRAIRKAAKLSSVGEYVLEGVEGDSLLRFVTGVLWKYSVASPENGRIELGPYQNTVRDVAFSRINVPKTIDALLIRLKRHRDDGDVFAYRAPKPDRQEGVNGYRLLVGGVFIFAKIDKRNPKHGALERASIRGKSNVPYVVMRAQDFEEFSLPARLIHTGRLSEFLDKQQGK
jgi:hypothetical protein